MSDVSCCNGYHDMIAIIFLSFECNAIQNWKQTYQLFNVKSVLILNVYKKIKRMIYKRPTSLHKDNNVNDNVRCDVCLLQLAFFELLGKAIWYAYMVK